MIDRAVSSRLRRKLPGELLPVGLVLAVLAIR